MTDKPRSPEDHDLTGTGSPRTDNDRLAQPGATSEADQHANDPAISTSAAASAHPAEADELAINRSGSGGSGGASADESGLAESEDGSRPQEMSEVLGGDGAYERGGG